MIPERVQDQQRSIPQPAEPATDEFGSTAFALEAQFPELSARRILTPGLRVTLIVAATIVTAGLLVAPIGTLVVIFGLLIATYLVTLSYKVWLYTLSHRHHPMVSVSDDDARATADPDLPVYTVLVPVYREPESIAQLLGALDQLEYSRGRLDVRILLEADDDATRAAVADYGPGSWVRIIDVPDVGPRTKPKALNYGLVDAPGEYVTIYDAEDVPEPLQLRRAVVAFARADPSVVCFQAKLGFYNSRQNLLTKWFTLEYSIWFSDFLPGVVATAAPVPLGGTSNHFRRAELVEVGAWDPFNVTEDADLGVRLARFGWNVGLLDSVTGEEATSDFVNWVKQRSRWYKGYLQTWLVHLRRPRDLRRDLGRRGFLGFNLMVGGTPLLAACNLASWGVTLTWLAFRPGWVGPLFPAWTYYLGLVAFVAGNATVVYLGVLSARLEGNHDLVWAALIVPIYWLVMGLAALKAITQLVVAPSFWEKTVHGMTAGSVIDLTHEQVDLGGHGAAMETT